MFLLFTESVAAQEENTMPIRGISIAAPQANQLDQFLDFMENVLAPNQINTLVLRVDYNYEYQSHPELRNEKTLSFTQVKEMVAMAKKTGIQIIPQINLFGHQSWHSDLGNLLTEYPEFDETPHIKLPEKYEWPNENGLYCKSYCPLHPQVHDVVFELVDEIVTVFEAKAFHAGLDEVFYIADDKCPRCAGEDPAALFAGEVTKIRNHLATQDVKLWIWGDRLIDGKTTGIGMWEASMNNTHRAIDMIPKDVVICDWHYERAEPTAAYFANKGFEVITCPWNQPAVAEAQIEQIMSLRAHSNPVIRSKVLGMMHTVWSSADSFIRQYQDSAGKTPDKNEKSQVDCFKTFVEAYQKLSNP